MKLKFCIIFVIVLGFNKFSYSNEINCDEFDKFTAEFLKCKADILKNKTIITGQNFVEDIKDYQKKEWSEEKEKVNKLKEKVLEK